MKYIMYANETVNNEEEWVIGPGGVKMTRKEFLEWKESERN